jgi:hypothetical protein
MSHKISIAICDMTHPQTECKDYECDTESKDQGCIHQHPRPSGWPVCRYEGDAE